MLDIKWIRDNPEALDRALKNRGAEPLSARILSLDETRRALIQSSQALQERRNAASKEIGRAKADKDEARAAALIAEVADIKARLPEEEARLKATEAELRDLLDGIPNVPLDDVPVGADESANVEVRRHGEPPRPNHARQHFEIGEALGLMDFEAAARLSGARFTVLKGPLARLERALGQFMLDLHTREHGYTEISPPILVRDEALYGTAQLPKFAEDQFQTARSGEREPDENELYAQARKNLIDRWAPGDYPEIELYREMERLRRQRQSSASRLWLIPTSEVPLTNLVREQILEEAALPIRVTALTPNFRSEAGAAGRDTRGMIRQHQFWKVELVSITTPESSLEELERMTACAEAVLKALGLAYRVVTLSTGDMGFASAKTYDIEVWLPGQGTYREISSCSVCTDFQARRMNARYRPAAGGAPRFVHTLNGSGVAVGRALIAILENYQNEDGTVTVPPALHPYMGGITRIEPAG